MTTDKALAGLWQLSALADRGPDTPETLHAYIKAILGFHIPRKAVCDSHQAPFDFVSDVYFNKHERFLVLGSRGSGKTRNLAITNLLVSKFNHGVGTAHLAAIETQSRWGFDYIREMVKPQYLMKDVTRLVAGAVRFKNKSWVMISTGRSITGVTALRAQRLIQDEIDLWEPETHETAQLLVTGTKRYGSQRIAASTAYNAHGLMSSLWAMRQDRQYSTYRWCVGPETLVATENGQKRIDRLKTGEKAWSLKKGELVLRPIERVGLTRRNALILQVELDNGAILKCTSDHEILTTRGYIPAAHLQIGIHSVILADSLTAKVTKAALAGRSDVWDCKVKDTHSFVANGIVVHNCLWESLVPCRICKGESCPFYIWTNPRTGQLEPLCKGRALRSDGFIPLDAAIDEYYSVDSETFAVQKLLLAPERRSLIYPTFDPGVHCKKAPMDLIWEHASFGIGVDWGFDHPLVFIVVAQLPNGKYWVVEELGERFATPDRELEIAQGLNEKYKKEASRNTVTDEITHTYPTFFPGQDQPKSIAAFAEAGLIVCPNQVKLREDGHRYIRRLLDKNRGPILFVDADLCPMLAYQLGRLHKDEKGREVLKENDFPDGARYVLGTAEELGGLSPGGHLIV